MTNKSYNMWLKTLQNIPWHVLGTFIYMNLIVAVMFKIVFFLLQIKQKVIASV